MLSPSFSDASTQTLARCLPPNGSTAWRGGADREMDLKLGLVAKGRCTLGMLESKKRRGKF